MGAQENKQFEFEVLNRDKDTIFFCNDIDCIPDDETLKQVSSAGYKFRLDRKIVSAKTVTQFKKEGLIK